MKATFQTALKEAMKARDQVRMDTIRSVLSAMDYESLQKGVEELPESTVTEILKREVKKRAEELEFAQKSGRAELIEKLQREVGVLEAFLPKQLSREELSAVIQQMKSADPKANMGVIMKQLKERYSGQYDAKLASELAK